MGTVEVVGRWRVIGPDSTTSGCVGDPRWLDRTRTGEQLVEMANRLWMGPGEYTFEFYEKRTVGRKTKEVVTHREVVVLEGNSR